MNLFEKYNKDISSNNCQHKTDKMPPTALDLKQIPINNVWCKNSLKCQDDNTENDLNRVKKLPINNVLDKKSLN